MSPPNPKSRQKFSKKNGIKLVGYTVRLQNYVKITPPILSDFSELAPPMTVAKAVRGPVYTIPFSFHIGLGKAVRYENFSCLLDAVFISYRIGFMPFQSVFIRKSENGMKHIGLVRSRVNRRPIRYGMKTVSCKQKANPI